MVPKLVRAMRWLAIAALYGSQLLQHFSYRFAGGAIGESHA